MGLYAALLIAGGLFGYLKAGSLVSMLMGTSFGIIFAILSFQKSKIAQTIAIFLTALMLGVFGYRFFLGFKFMPAGLMTIISFVLFIKLLRELAISNACCKTDKDKCCIPSSHKKP